MLHISKPRVRKETETTMRKEKREYSSTEQNDPSPDPTEEIGNNAIHKNDVNGKSVTMLRWDSQCRAVGIKYVILHKSANSGCLIRRQGVRASCCI